MSAITPGIRIPSTEEITTLQKELKKILTCPVSTNAAGKHQLLNKPCTLSPCGDTVSRVAAMQKHGPYFPHAYDCCSLQNADGLPSLNPCSVCESTVATWTEDPQLQGILKVFEQTFPEQSSSTPTKTPTEEGIRAVWEAFLKYLVDPVTHELENEPVALSPCGHSVNQGTAAILYGPVKEVNPPVLSSRLVDGKTLELRRSRCTPHPCPHLGCHQTVLTWTRNKVLKKVADLFEKTFDPAATTLPVIEESLKTHFLPASNQMARFAPHASDVEHTNEAANDENTNYFQWDSTHPDRSLLLRFELTTMAGIHYTALQFRCPDLRTYLRAQGFEVNPLGKPREEGPDRGTYDVYECSPNTKEQFQTLIEAIKHYSVMENSEGLDLSMLSPRQKALLGLNPKDLEFCEEVIATSSPDQIQPVSKLRHVLANSAHIETRRS